MKSSLINQQHLHFEELYALGAIDGEAQDHVVSMVLSRDIQTTGWKVLEDCFEMVFRNNSCVFLKKFSVSRCCFLELP